MSIVVPEAEGRVVQGVLIAQNAQGCRAQHQVARVTRRQTNPPRRKHAEEVTVAEQEDTAAGCAKPVDDAISAGAYFGDRFAARATVSEELPARPLEADLASPPAFVRAVVPFSQVGNDLDAGFEASQLAGAAGTPERADQDAADGRPPEPIAEIGRVPLASIRKGQVGAARMLTGDRPGRLAVPGQVNFGKHFRHGLGLD
jgi:hypothetical protein